VAPYIQDDDALLELWREHRRRGDRRSREQLILSLAPLVKYVAYRKTRELPPHVEVDDLISCGLEAVIRAIDRFDPERGVSLTQFAWSRIHGSMLDELRRTDWASRSVRRWERELEEATQEFAAVQRRRPTDAELAAALSLTRDELRARRADIARSDVTSLSALVVPGTERDATELLVATDSGGDPEAHVALVEAKDALMRAIEGLEGDERAVSVMLIVQDLRPEEVGEVLGVSPARVHELHRRAKRTIRAALRPEDPVTVPAR